MGHLWTPWRLPYILSQDKSSCIFCDALEAGDDEGSLILLRANLAFVILNRYPYNNGHVMVAPYAHQSVLGELDAPVRCELMELATLTESVLREAYSPHGLNMGLNLGSAAGAGVEGHLHLHVVPRWNGDTNYMASLNDVRIIPERLEESYARLQPLFSRGSA
jgi:ATP adenylyltransferase